MKLHRGTAVAALCGVALAPAAGCGHRDEPSSACRIRYERTEGEPSRRVDELFLSDDGLTLTRTVYRDGEGVPDEAIYYLFDTEGRLLLEALDDGADGDIDARLDQGELLNDRISNRIIDRLIDDNTIDGIQTSIDLPTSPIGPWNPARLFFQVPCDQGRATLSDLDEDTVRIALDSDADPEADTVMTVQHNEQGYPQSWLIDRDLDGIPEDSATVLYNPAGQVVSVEWLRQGTFLGNIYTTARYTYDRDGYLYSYSADSDGDGEDDERVVYSAGCFGDAFAPRAR